jgi:hypothetical protein
VSSEWVPAVKGNHQVRHIDLTKGILPLLHALATMNFVKEISGGTWKLWVYYRVFAYGIVKKSNLRIHMMWAGVVTQW